MKSHSGIFIRPGVENCLAGTQPGLFHFWLPAYIMLGLEPGQMGPDELTITRTRIQICCINQGRPPKKNFAVTISQPKPLGVEE